MFHRLKSLIVSRRQLITDRIQLRTAHTAGIIVVGDEVLKGQVQDTNSHFLAQQLHTRGYRLQHICVCPDHVVMLSQTMKMFSNKYDIVLTTGGIGPTHDDVTYEALALAFGDKLHKHPKIVDMCRQFFQTDDINHPGMKLSLIPESAKLTFGTDATGKKSLYPTVSLENIFVFPGVPHMCQRMFHMTADIIVPVVGKFYNSSIYLSANESDIAPILDLAVTNFSNVVFGSYPVYFHSYYDVKITLESLNEEENLKAKTFLMSSLQGVVHFDPTPFQNKKIKIEKLGNALVNQTMEKIRNFTKQHSHENIYFYFDGGKNSTLLLHLISCAFDDLNVTFNVVHVERNPKITKFVEKTIRNYKANCLNLNEDNFNRFLKYNANISLIRGARISDPSYKTTKSYFSNIEVFNPISEWHYHDIWQAIRSLCLPYCNLYDRGFSSLSSGINSNLITTGPRKDLTYYKSAYLLQDKRLE